MSATITTNMGKTPWNKGKPANPESIEKARQRIREQYKNGRVPWNKGKKGIQVSFRKGKKYSDIAGEKHWHWKGGRSRVWCWKVMEESGREKKCVKCGVIEKLQVHHINHNQHDNRLENLEYRCGPCHRQEHPHLLKGHPSPLKGKKGLWGANKASFKKGQHVSSPTEFKKGQLAWWQKLGFHSVWEAIEARKKEQS